MQKGIKNIFPDAVCTLLPVADGGDGTIEIISSVLKGKLEHLTVPGPCGKSIMTNYFCLEDGKTCIIELAQASGIKHLDKLASLEANTYGTGLLIKDALDKNIENIILTVGGSASTDGGTGILCALGAEFLDVSGQSLSPDGGNLSKISKIDLSKINPKWRQSSIKIACDVNNPLYGPTGAAYIFAPQKGASEKEVKILDHGLRHFSKILLETTHSKTDPDMPGAGAAGGVPFALSCVFDARIVSGFDWISDIFDLEKKLEDSDIVITGEGAFDEQSLHGKAAGKILDLCGQHKKPLWIFPACLNTEGYDFVSNQARVFPAQQIQNQLVSLDDITNAVEAACLALEQ